MKNFSLRAQGEPKFAIGFVFLLLLSRTLASPFASTLLASDLGPTSHDEANLRGVTFIDPDRGWVAGDRGTVLHTEDRGESWKPQPTGTKANLADIAMYNSNRGLAVGGYYQGYTQLSIGEVIVTDNGGQSWRSTTGHDLPRLRQLIIGPGGKCVAVGDWSPVHLTSVFASGNGGQTWQPQTCQFVGSAVSIAGSVDDYLVLSDQGDVVRFKNNVNPQPLFPANDEWRLLAGNGNQRMLVGPRGMIESQDQGETWQVNPKHLDAANAFAPASIELGETATAFMWKGETWAASDANASIVTFRPSSVDAVPHQGQASIRRIIRLDDDRGWAVGDFGLILATRDASKSWRTLRSGNQLPAVMMVGTQAVSMPWTLLAIESLQHHRRVSLVIDRSDRKVSAVERDRLMDATGSLGPSSFFVASSTGNRIAEILRTCKPAVIVLDQTLQPEQRAAWSAAALETNVQRVLDVSDHGSQTVHVATAIPTAGILASDVWFDAIAIVSPSYLPPSKVMLSARLDATNDRFAGDGLANCVGNDPRFCWSKKTTNSRRQLQVLQARTTELSWVESLVTSSKSPAEFKSLLASVQPRIVDRDRQRVFARLLALTGKYARHDLHVAALEAFVENAARRPDNLAEQTDDLLSLARLRLKAVRASAEWHQTFGSSAMVVSSSRMVGSTDSSQSPVNLAVQLSPFQTQVSPMMDLTSGFQRAGGFARYDETSGQAVRLAGGTTQNETAKNNTSTLKVDPRWEFHPAVLMVGRASERTETALAFPLQTLDLSILDQTEPAGNAASSSIALGQEDDSSVVITNLRRLSENSTSGKWGVLASDRVLPTTIDCPRATSRPQLDGLFDEVWWSPARPIDDSTLHDQTLTVNASLGTVRLAHDDNFLYLAIDAPALKAARQNAKIRQRDTPLDGSDRYCVRLDVDRDLMTAYEFEFDSAGNTRDSCDGFLEFQPRWFIACNESENRTVAEIAIQKSDISAEIELAGRIWNLSLERLTSQTPGRGLAIPDAGPWHPILLE